MCQKLFIFLGTCSMVPGCERCCLFSWLNRIGVIAVHYIRVGRERIVTSGFHIARVACYFVACIEIHRL